jgi:hypothetical protein
MKRNFGVTVLYYLLKAPECFPGPVGPNTMYLKQCVCLKNCLCMAIRSGQSWQTMGTVLDDSIDLSKSALRTQNFVLQKQISCLGES